MLSKEQIEAIEQKLGYKWKNKEYLQTAFTHSSFAYSHNLISNERFEFLGDSILNFCTTKFLFDNFNFAEGVCSKIRAYLVSSEYVSKYIFDAGLEKNLLCDNFNPEKSTNVMGDLFEAIVGAMFLDSDLEQCKKFVYASLKYSKELVDSVLKLTRDYKSELQEFLQQTTGNTLEYVVISKKGPAHKPEFEIAAMINGKKYATAFGSSKKEAENLAAEKTLEILKK